MTVEDCWEIDTSDQRYDRDYCIDTVLKRYEDNENDYS